MSKAGTKRTFPAWLPSLIPVRRQGFNSVPYLAPGPRLLVLPPPPAQLPPLPLRCPIGLLAAHSQLELARGLATSGDFCGAGEAYARVQGQLRGVTAGVAEPELHAAWTVFLRALQHERELVAAWQAECAEMEAWAAGGEARPLAYGCECKASESQPAALLVAWVTRDRSPSSPTANPCMHIFSPGQQAHAPARASTGGCGAGRRGAAAFSVDPRSFEVLELAPAPRPAPASTPPDRDLDVWLPPDDAAPQQLGATLSRERTRREREEAYERQRRESLTPGGSAG